ncbi:DUF4349 domain-containing protein [Alkaliphilus serpentinus]|nr:DUF4349 domain-containing protein [Alkaliphilus serpentinus]
MDCKNFDYYSSLYIDDMLSENEREDFLQHIEECSICKMALKNLQTVVECLKDIEDIELPPDFNTTLRQRLTSIEQPQITKTKKTLQWASKHWKGLAASLMIVVFSAAAFNAINGPLQYKASEELAYDSAPAEAPEEGGMNLFTTSMDQKTAEAEEYGNMEDSSNDVVVTGVRGRREVSLQFSEAMEAQEPQEAQSPMKLIHQGRLRIESSNFDGVYDNIINLVDEYRGYFQHSEIYYRQIVRDHPENSIRVANLSIRIPGDDFMEVFQKLRDLGVVLNHNISTVNITDQYRDIENEAKNLEIQEERLREILGKADKVEDLLRIENELSRVRNQINSLRGTLDNYDKLVSMATIDLELQEIKDPTIRIQPVDEGIWSKAKANFVNSVNSIIVITEKVFIKAFAILPVIILLAALSIILIVVYWMIKR